jgi:cold-inducible RNA-binding protein
MLAVRPSIAACWSPRLKPNRAVLASPSDTRISRSCPPLRFTSVLLCRSGIEQNMSRKLYVGNLPYDTSDQDLQALFATAGNVESVQVMRDTATGRARGFAFVEMATEEEAQAAIRQLAEHSLGGRQLTVNEARPKGDSRGGGGGGGARPSSRRSERRW